MARHRRRAIAAVDERKIILEPPIGFEPMTGRLRIVVCIRPVSSILKPPYMGAGGPLTAFMPIYSAVQIPKDHPVMK